MHSAHYEGHKVQVVLFKKLPVGHEFVHVWEYNNNGELHDVHIVAEF